jgi:putative PIN family toxin of toxin-antitoxin system
VLIDKEFGIVYDTNMRGPQIVIDTNVLVAALRSRRGASYRLLSLIDSGKFEVNVSVPLVLEYEDAAKRLVGEFALMVRDIDNIIDYVCAVAQHRRVFYLWRPFLRDPKDDMVLELAVSANCDTIVTFNVDDFEGVDEFGLRVMTPRDFLRKIGELP